MELKDPNALKGITLDFVVEHALESVVDKGRIIVIRNGSLEQINSISKGIVSKFNEKYPSREVFVFDSKNVDPEIYNLNNPESKSLKIIKDYFNSFELNPRDDYYSIDTIGCFGYNFPQ